MRGYAPTAIPPRDADFETLARNALALIAALGHFMHREGPDDFAANLLTHLASSKCRSEGRSFATVAN